MNRGRSGGCHVTKVLLGSQMLKIHLKVSVDLSCSASMWICYLDQWYTCRSSCLRCFAEDCFQETVEAMVHLGIDAERRGQIFMVNHPHEEI